MGSAPPNVAVERDFEGSGDAASNLQLVEVFNAGTRGLDLAYVIRVSLIEIFKLRTDLNCQCMKRRNYIESTICNMVNLQRRVELPYRCLVLNYSYVSDMCHDINIGKVDDVAQTPGWNS